MSLITSTSSNNATFFLDENNGNLTINGSVAVVGNLTGNMQGATEFQATAGEALNIGEPVYISSFDETNGTYIVQKADAKDQTKMPCVGLTKETVAVNGNVKVVTSGLLNNLNTNAFSQGDILYVSINAGALTKVKPFKGNYAFLLTQSIGKVMRKHLTQGSVNIIIGEVDVPNLNHKNVFIGNSSNITEKKQLVLDDISFNSFNADKINGKNLDEIFPRMQSKFIISGGGIIKWGTTAAGQNQLSWTQRFIIMGNFVKGTHFNIDANTIQLKSFEVAYIRPTDAEWSSGTYSSITLQKSDYKSYTPELNDIIIAFHHGDDNILYLMDGRIIDYDYAFNCNGSRTYKGKIGIQTNSPDFPLQVGTATQIPYYDTSYKTTPLAIPLTFEHSWGVDGPDKATANAYFFSNSSWTSNKDMAGAIGFGARNWHFNAYYVIYARMGGRRLGNLYGGFVFQTMQNRNDGTLRNAMVIQNGRVGINAQDPTETLEIGGNLKVTGSLSKATGSFDIPHPDPQKKDTHRLRHYFVETPSSGGNIYKYRIDCTKGVNTMDLPNYFKFLNNDTNGLVLVSPYKHFGRGWGDIIHDGEKLEVHAEQNGVYNVMVFVDRKDDIAMENFNKYGVEYSV